MYYSTEKSKLEWLCKRAGIRREGSQALVTLGHPGEFLQACAQALESGVQALAFGHADWGLNHWKRFPFAPQHIYGEHPMLEGLSAYKQPQWGEAPWILVPTGGSSGRVRLAVHSLETLQAAARGFLEHFEAHCQPYTALCVLPLYHVSGFMQVVRASACEHGRVFFLDFRALRQGAFPALDPQKCSLSLVPRQLQLLLETPACRSWLERLGLLLVGGGPLPAALAQAAQGLPLVESYGLTEAAGTVATRRLDQAAFHPLPHMDMRLDSEGCLKLKSPACMHGYYGAAQAYAGHTQDRARALDTEGWELLGRMGRSFTTRGGETLDPEPIERILLQSGLCLQAHVYLDQEGVLAAQVVPSASNITQTQLEACMLQQLDRAHCPKIWHMCSQLERNALGK